MAMWVEKSNYVRILRLLLDIGTEVYRDTFKNRFPSVSSYGHILTPLKKQLVSLLNESQREILFPSTGKYEGDLSDLDISVLYILLRNISNIQPHINGWGKEPQDTDRSISANIERIRIIRNKCIFHSSYSKLSRTAFQNQWDILQRSILELSGGDTLKQKIDELLTTSLDPNSDEHYINVIESMIEKEKTVKSYEQLFKGMYVY